MGNNSSASCQMSNYSKRNVRVFVTDSTLEVDAFITSQCDGEHENPSAGKTLCFRKDGGGGVRVPASQTQQVPWAAQHFLSVFVEDEDDESICSKQIIHNMALSAAVAVLLYDV